MSNVFFEKLIDICPYCDVIHRDGEWTCGCRSPKFKEMDDTPLCSEDICPIIKIKDESKNS